jgi:hypothetical protein
VTLAPRSNRDGVDFFAIWTLHETHNAIPTHQIACLAQGAFFGNELDDATTGQSIPQKP